MITISIWERQDGPLVVIEGKYYFRVTKASLSRLQKFMQGKNCKLTLYEGGQNFMDCEIEMGRNLD